MTNRRMVTVQEVDKAAWVCAQQIYDSTKGRRPLYLHGIPRGGISALGYVMRHMGPSQQLIHATDDPGEASVFVDDIVDSGATQRRYNNQYPGRPFFSLFHRATLGTDWLVFPWESTNVADTQDAADIPTRLLQYVGEDVKREGLKETPSRFLKALQDWTRGYKQDPKTVLKAFSDGATNYNEFVLVSNIPTYSHCEHHLTPMFGLTHVGYIPKGKIVGLSKLARLVDIFARRFQVQERITTQIADALEDELAPRGVGVVMQLRHLCMESRGVAAYGSVTTTSALRGCLRTESESRAEFLKLVEQGRNGVTV